MAYEPSTLTVNPTGNPTFTVVVKRSWDSSTNLPLLPENHPRIWSAVLISDLPRRLADAWASEIESTLRR